MGKRFEQRPWRDEDTPGARDQKDAMERQRAERERYREIVVLVGEAAERALAIADGRQRRREEAAKRCAIIGHLWKYNTFTGKLSCPCCGKDYDGK